eukprot:TRINITY_DN8387_c0_g1_i1.p1 TRINITY_DN8387_c0_g1~~TRINITY_DN8387_c0_g1_i1.p1  ORF type:complete len:128 (+),score=7.64 TRINITY_DN8387_c0_g1_i1:231-614(+)
MLVVLKLRKRVPQVAQDLNVVRLFLQRLQVLFRSQLILPLFEVHASYVVQHLRVFGREFDGLFKGSEGVFFLAQFGQGDAAAYENVHFVQVVLDLQPLATTQEGKLLEVDQGFTVLALTQIGQPQVV